MNIVIAGRLGIHRGEDAIERIGYGQAGVAGEGKAKGLSLPSPGLEDLDLIHFLYAK